MLGSLDRPVDDPCPAGLAVHARRGLADAGGAWSRIPMLDPLGKRDGSEHGTTCAAQGLSRLSTASAVAATAVAGAIGFAALLCQHMLLTAIGLAKGRGCCWPAPWRRLHAACRRYPCLDHRAGALILLGVLTAIVGALSSSGWSTARR